MSYKTGDEESRGEKRCMPFPGLPCSSLHPAGAEQPQSHHPRSRPPARGLPCPAAGTATARLGSPSLVAMHI